MQFRLAEPPKGILSCDDDDLVPRLKIKSSSFQGGVVRSGILRRPYANIPALPCVPYSGSVAYMAQGPEKSLHETLRAKEARNSLRRGGSRNIMQEVTLDKDLGQSLTRVHL